MFSFGQCFMILSLCLFAGAGFCLNTVSCFLHTLQDVFRLLTPGGGGYGSPNVVTSFEKVTDQKQTPMFIERGSVYEYHRAQESV
jgi:N-methylhydantoinase B/oxoprolinase/acetone carboxylase alpha subunit